MSPEQLTTTLLTATYTRDDLHHLIGLLRTFFEEYFFTEGEKGPLEEAFTHFREARPQEQALRSLHLNHDFFASFSRERLYDQLEAMGAYAEKLPTAMITVAIPTTPKTVTTVGRWFRERVHPTSLIDCSTDPRLIAGCRIAWNNQSTEYSLAQQPLREQVTQVLEERHGTD